MSQSEGRGASQRVVASVVLLVVAFLAGWFGHALTADRPATEVTPPSVDAGETVAERADDRQFDSPVLQGRPVDQETSKPTSADPGVDSVPEVQGHVASSTSINYIEESERAETGSLRVHVRHPSGDPAGGVTVSIVCRGGKPTPDEVSDDASGLAEFQGMDEGIWRIDCSFTGGSLWLTAAVFAGCVTEVGLVLPTRGSTFEGLVTDVITGPVEGETVTLTSAGGWTRAKLTTQTDRRGWFRFEGVPPGRWSVHLASWQSNSGFSRATSDLVAPGRTTRRDFSVGPRLRGVVRHGWTSAPVAGARVECRARGRLLDYTRSDSEGAFAFRSNLPSTLSLHVSKKGYSLAILSDIEITEEGTVVDVELAGAAGLRLRVTDSQGDPVSGALVVTAVPKVEGQGRLVSINVILDDEGGGFCDQILPGSYEVAFIAEGIGEARVEVTLDPGENNLQIQLRQSGR